MADLTDSLSPNHYVDHVATVENADPTALWMGTEFYLPRYADTLYDGMGRATWGYTEAPASGVPIPKRWNPNTSTWDVIPGP